MWCWSYRVQEISEEEIDSQKPKDDGKEKEREEEHKSSGREDDTFDDGHDEASDNKQSDYMPAVWHGLKGDVRTRGEMWSSTRRRGPPTGGNARSSGAFPNGKQ